MLLMKIRLDDRLFQTTATYTTQEYLTLRKLERLVENTTMFFSGYYSMNMQNIF